MRVVVLSRALLEQVGGPGVATLGFARGLAKMGASVHVVALEDAEGDWMTNEDQARNDGFELHRLKPAPSLPARVAQLMRTVPLSEQRSVVWVNGVWGPQSIAARLLAAIRGYPYVVRPAGSLGHAALRYRRRKKQLYYSLVERGILRRAAAVHCMSQDELLQLPRELHHLAFVVPTGVEVADAPLPAGDAGRPLVGVLARIHRIKRHHLVLDAIAKLAPDEPGLELELAGSVSDAGYATELRDRVQRSVVLRDRVRFLGHVEPGRVPQIVARWRTALLLSEQENFGHAVIAAAAAGTPTIVSRGVALAQALSASGAGRVVDAEPTAIASAIRAALAADRGVVRARCVAFAREFSWESCTVALFDRLARIAQGESRSVAPAVAEKP